MDIEEVSNFIKLADDLVYVKKQQHLSCLQKELLSGVLTGLTYKQIKADKTKELHHYPVEHIGSYIAYELWKLLTQVFHDLGIIYWKEKVNRNNLKAYLQRVIKQQFQKIESLEITNSKNIIETEPNLANNSKNGLTHSQNIIKIAVEESSLKPRRNFSTTNWVGRKEIITEISHKLNTGCRILSLVGITGIGKTALAGRLTIEPAILQKFPIVKLVSFEAEPPNFDVVAHCILGDEIAADEVLLQSPEKLVAAMVAKLQTQPYLVILDMVEEVLELNSNGVHQFKESVFAKFLEQVVKAENLASRIVITSQYQIPVLAEGRYQAKTNIIRLTGLKKNEALGLFDFWDINENTEAEVSLINRLIHVYEGHPLALKVIAGEIKESPYYGNIQAYWHDYGQEIEAVEDFKISSEECSDQDKPRLDRYSINLTDLVKMRVEKTFTRLLESSPLACLMLCMGAKYRRAVERQAWLILINEYSEENSLMAFQILQRRYFLEEESTPHKVLYRLHSLLRRVALDNLPKIKDEVLPP